MKGINYLLKLFIGLSLSFMSSYANNNNTFINEKYTCRIDSIVGNGWKNIYKYYDNGDYKVMYYEQKKDSTWICMQMVSTRTEGNKRTFLFDCIYDSTLHESGLKTVNYNNLDENEKYILDANTIQNSDYHRKDEVELNSDGNPVKSTRYLWNHEQKKWILVTEKIYTYTTDDCHSGSMIATNKVDFYGNVKTDGTTIKVDFKFDDKENKSAVIYRRDGEEWIPSYKTVYELGQNGKDYISITERYVNGEWFITEDFREKYDENGHNIYKYWNQYVKSSSDYREIKVSNTSYDSNGTKVYNTDSTWRNGKLVDIHFDSLHNASTGLYSKLSYSSDDGKEWKLNSKMKDCNNKYWFVDDKDSIYSETYRDINGDTLQVTSTWRKDDNGKDWRLCRKYSKQKSIIDETHTQISTSQYYIDEDNNDNLEEWYSKTMIIDESTTLQSVLYIQDDDFHNLIHDNGINKYKIYKCAFEGFYNQSFEVFYSPLDKDDIIPCIPLSFQDIDGLYVKYSECDNRTMFFNKMVIAVMSNGKRKIFF